MSKPIHILVVDDDGAVREVLEAMLESPTCRISTVNGGKAMRDFLDANGPIDLVVLDGDMAGEKSASLALYLKELRIRLVMSSGSPAIMEFAKENRLQLLTKPFKSDQLDEAIKKAFDSGEFGQRGA
jgi:two-component system OmpR family response regulator